MSWRAYFLCIKIREMPKQKNSVNRTKKRKRNKKEQVRLQTQILQRIGIYLVYANRRAIDVVSVNKHSIRIYWVDPDTLETGDTLIENFTNLKKMQSIWQKEGILLQNNSLLPYTDMIRHIEERETDKQRGYGKHKQNGGTAHQANGHAIG